MDVARVERKARALMNGKYRKGEKLPLMYYDILEDANFHTLNNKLTKAGAFGPFETHHYDSGDIYVPKGSGEDTHKPGVWFDGYEEM